MTITTKNFKAMGTDCEILIHTTLSEEKTNKLAELAEQRVRILEDSWTRFKPDSALSQFNSLNGLPDIQVNQDLWRLLNTMKQAWELTEGAYDPTVIHALRHHGYNQTLTNLPLDDTPTSPTAVQGLAGMTLNETAHTVFLPAGVEVDPGGIGKGLAADIIVEEFMLVGVSGILVNLGGDIVFAGQPSEENSIEWSIMLPYQENVYLFPRSPEPVAIATSSPKSRRWGSTRHHVINPKTGQPAESPIHTVTITANSGWEAEAWTTATILAGVNAPELLQKHHLSGTIVWANETVTHHRTVQHYSPLEVSQ